MNKIPRDPSWCSYCLLAEQYGRAKGEPCESHASGEYSGHDAYDPSEWVLEVVGIRYGGLYGVFLCFGYDPRHGFWMRSEETGEERNISERAIGRTYHRIQE